MTPESFQSPWCQSTHYLIRWVRNGSTVVVIVANGTQPNDGLSFPNRKEATAWLRDNGFVKVGA